MCGCFRCVYEGVHRLLQRVLILSTERRPRDGVRRLLPHVFIRSFMRYTWSNTCGLSPRVLTLSAERCSRAPRTRTGPMASVHASLARAAAVYPVPRPATGGADCAVLCSYCVPTMVRVGHVHAQNGDSMVRERELKAHWTDHQYCTSHYNRPRPAPTQQPS